MKEMMVVGILLGLCTSGMGAQNNPYGETEVLPVYLSQMDINGQPETQINLDQLVGCEKQLSDADRLISLETELKEEKSALNYYYRSSDLSLLGFLFNATAIPAIAFKIISYVQAYSTCNTIKENGGTCDNVNHIINPCDPQLSHSRLAPITCKMSAVADVCAYASVLVYIGITAYFFYRHCTGPQRRKHSVD